MSSFTFNNQLMVYKKHQGQGGRKIINQEFTLVND